MNSNNNIINKSDTITTNNFSFRYPKNIQNNISNSIIHYFIESNFYEIYENKDNVDDEYYSINYDYWEDYFHYLDNNNEEQNKTELNLD